MRSLQTRRLNQLSELFMQLDWLYTELAIPPPTCDEQPSSSTFLAPPFQHSLSSSDPFMSSVSSMSTPTPASRSSRSSLFPTSDSTPEYHKIFALFLLRLDEADAEGKVVEPGKFLGVEGVEPTVGLISWAEHRKAELDDIKSRRETQIQSMYDQLVALWKRLGVEEEDMDEFVDNNRGSTEETVAAYETELERMMELKRDRMSVFIDNARTEIEALWNDLMVGDEERADFVPLIDGEDFYYSLSSTLNLFFSFR